MKVNAIVWAKLVVLCCVVDVDFVVDVALCLRQLKIVYTELCFARNEGNASIIDPTISYLSSNTTKGSTICSKVKHGTQVWCASEAYSTYLKESGYVFA